MQIVFRTDASIEIGTGHVMRCLTLADALTQQGHSCVFICRAHVGHLGELIQSKGYTLHLLPLTDLSTAAQELSWNAHAPWLGTSWQQDADQTIALLKQQKVDWLIVDHYALDYQWERRVQVGCHRLMVMDDLADRAHRCNLLLDQTYGREPKDYEPLVPDHCEILCGSQYALLRPEFAQWREYSLKRRADAELKQLLINLGGVDKDNVTGTVLDTLQACTLPDDCRIVIVMGPTAPWLEQVRLQAQKLPWTTEVKIGVTNMAQLMADSDLAIGAAGSTTWERCCLGLPTLMLVLAENQQMIAQRLGVAGACHVVELQDQECQLKEALDMLTNKHLQNFTTKASAITDGSGIDQVVHYLVALA